MVEMPPATKAFARARSRGRALRVVARTGNGAAVTIYNIDGVSNGHRDKQLAAITNGLFQAVRGEIAQQGDTFCGLGGRLQRRAGGPAGLAAAHGGGWMDGCGSPSGLERRQAAVAHLLRGQLGRG